MHVYQKHIVLVYNTQISMTLTDFNLIHANINFAIAEVRENILYYLNITSINQHNQLELNIL
jgi:hypothetical protein